MPYDISIKKVALAGVSTLYPYVRYTLTEIGLRKSWTCDLERTPQVGPLRNHSLDSRIEHSQVSRTSQSRKGRLHEPRFTYNGTRRTRCFGFCCSYAGSAEPETSHRCGSEGWGQENHSLRVSVRKIFIHPEESFEDLFLKSGKQFERLN